VEALLHSGFSARKLHVENLPPNAGAMLALKHISRASR
jgi:hypothetical protein